jgi:hypothetical protein
MKCLTTTNFRQLCQEHGISAKTGYKWKERFVNNGLAGLEDESRRPQGHPGGGGNRAFGRFPYAPSPECAETFPKAVQPTPNE